MESDEDAIVIRRRSPLFRPRVRLTDPTLFEERFRLTSTQADKLLRLLGPSLQANALHINRMTAKDKLLVALRFYASNSFFYTIGDANGWPFDLYDT